MNFTNIKQKLLGFTIVFILSTVVSNAQFVSPKKKQKTVRHGQWHPSSSLKDLLPKTIVLNCKYPNDSIWREKLGNIIEAPKGEETKVKNAYKALFNKADTANPTFINDPNAKERALNNRIIAYYAKLCAFVYYADMDTITTGNTWHKLSENNKRNHFRDRAIGFMKKIDYRGHIKGFEMLQYSSKGLLMALQAYDLLKAAGGVPQSDLDDMKYSLQWWAKDVYRKANNIGGVWAHKNNHSLITGAALGMAAIVLNDCGWKTKQKDYWKPDHWANKANYQMERTMHTGNDPMSSDDGWAGYAEGPHYCWYSFTSLVPFFNAYLNFLPYKQSIDYKDYHAIHILDNPDETNVQNYCYNERYKNIMGWLAYNTNAQGTYETFDATALSNPKGFILNIFYDANKNLFPYNWTAGKGMDEVNCGLEVEFVANLMPPGPDEEKPNIVLRDGGLAKLSNESSGNDKITLKFLGERDESNNGGWHEHADCGSFVIQAGEDPLIIDPGYIPTGFYFFNPFLNLIVHGNDYTNKGRHHNTILVKDHILGAGLVFTGPLMNTNGNLSEIIDLKDGKKVENTFSHHNINFTRKIRSFKTDSFYFYVVSDVAKGPGSKKDYRFVLNGNGNEDEGTLLVRDLRGVEMARFHLDEKSQTMTADLRNLASGTYIIQIISPKASSQPVKLIINN